MIHVLSTAHMKELGCWFLKVSFFSLRTLITTMLPLPTGSSLIYWKLHDYQLCISRHKWLKMYMEELLRLKATPTRQLRQVR